MQIFGQMIHHPNLWHLNRSCVANALSIGLIWAWVPVPFQMVFSAATAILFRANLALSVATVWITNPITMPPLYYFAYRIGRTILDVPAKKFTFELSWEWLASGLSGIWQPFLLGCAICGITSAIIGNIVVRLAWRHSIRQLWKKRQFKRRIKNITLKKQSSDLE